MQSEENDDGSTLTIENWTGKPVEYRVVVVGDESPPHEPRFGERVRYEIPALCVFPALQARLSQIAHAIDRDAEQRASEAADAYIGEYRDLRRKVENLAKELRYTIYGEEYGRGFVDDCRDVVDADAFLARLPEIFGETTMAERPSRPVTGSRVLAWVDDSWESCIYNGPERGSFAWDFDTWGLPDAAVSHWRSLPPSPGDEP